MKSISKLFVATGIIFSFIFGAVLILPSQVSAATLFSDSFGSSSNSTVTGWEDSDGSGNDVRIKTGAGDSKTGSATDAFVNFKKKTTNIIKTGVSTSGYQNIHLIYYWRGKSSEPGDQLIVEWKKSSDSGYLNLATHDLDDETWSSPAEDITLPAQANDTSIDIRFRLNADADNDEAFLDDVSITGDLILTTGSLVVTKNTTGGDGTFDFTGDAGNFEIDTLGNTGSETINDLEPGEYSVTETAQEGWVESSNTCVDVSVTAGNTSGCTITNTKLGKIIIQKNVIGSDDEFDFSADYQDDFTLSDDEENESEFLEPGTYSVSEEADDDYTTTAVCSDESDPSEIELGAGETVTCVFTNTIKQGGITVIKQTFPIDSEELFYFYIGLNSEDSEEGIEEEFSLGNGDSEQFDLDPGVYSVSEIDIPEGWDQTSVTCVDQDDNSQSPSELVLEPEGNIVCTFINTERGHLIVNKVTDPESDDTEFSVTIDGDNTIFSDSDDSISVSSPADYEVAPGTYSVSEEEQEGWALTSNGCQDISIEAGETKECTIINTKLGSITIYKNTDPEESEQAFDFTIIGDDFEEEQTVFSGGSGVFYDLLPGDYTITEALPSGWNFDSATCGDGEEQDSFENGDVYGLEAGENIICTFNNIFNPESEPEPESETGTIIIVKNTVGGNATFPFASDFTDGNFEIQTAEGSGQESFFDIFPDVYSVSEITPDGWTLLSAVCSDESEPSAINLSAGETVTCTFTNTIESNEEEDESGPITTSGNIPRKPANTNNDNNQNNQAGGGGEVLGAEKFIFTLFMKKGPPHKGGAYQEEVTELQKRLKAEGYYIGPIDGKFGPITEDAVRAYQFAHPPLKVDGIVGPKTRAVLNA